MKSLQQSKCWPETDRRGTAWLVAACLTGLAGCGTTATPASDDASSDSAADLSLADLPGDATASQDPLVGTWTFSGDVPDIVTITLTLNADKSFAFAETVAPLTLPAGTGPTTCVTTDYLHGSYAETAPGGVNTLTLTIAGGTDNAVSLCAAATMDSAGSPMTPADITAFTAQGLLLATTQTYTVNSNTLVLTDTTTGRSKSFAK